MTSESSNNPVSGVQTPDVPEYLRLRRSIGWVVLGVVLASFPFLARNNLGLAGLLSLIAISYNALLYLWILLKRKWFASKFAILTIDSFFILLLIALSDGRFNSPYVSLLLFPIISSAMWFGTVMAIIVSLFETIATGSLLVSISDFWDWSAVAKNFGFRMLIFMLIGMYLARLTHEERLEHNALAEKDLQINQERQQLLALINNIGDAVLVVDQLGKINLFNEMTAKLTGSQYALVGQPLISVFPFHDGQGKPVDLLAFTSTATVKRRDLKLDLKDSSTIDVEADISPYIVNQKSRGFIVILRDITKEKTLEEEQQEFISVASHELRTPLTIAEANISNSLASPNAPVDPTVQNMLDQAHSNIIFLSHIVNDLTTLSRAKQEAIEVDPNPLNPSDLLRELASEHTAAAQAKGIAIILSIPNQVKPILTSRHRIKQVLQNFLTNAVKYTTSGSITLAVENAPREQDGVVFSVSDTGMGISVSDQKKLFTKFFRSEDYRTRESGGSGLGLYISAKLTERLNGKIWFESELKKGSTFYLQVPPYSQLKKDHAKMVKAEAENFFGAL